jgi:histidine triad (HIT) family protein
MDCIFCKIIAGDIPSHKVYEDHATLAFLDINPAQRGHTLVIPKQHAANLLAMPADALHAVARATQQVANQLQQVVQFDGLNVVQSNGEAAGQTVFHYHVHLIPRFANDHALHLWQPGATDHAVLGALAAELRNTGA